MVRRGAGASVDPIGSLQDVVASTFTTVQASRISERKEIVKLHKHMLACAAVQVEVEGGKTRLSGEKAFSDAIKGALTHVLPFKRGTAPASIRARLPAGKRRAAAGPARHRRGAARRAAPRAGRT